jgi:uncharacterized protein YbjT (DUF2867 family)
MSPQTTFAVTGAFGYSGRHIAERLLAEGHVVRTLTNSPGRQGALAGRVEVHPLAFADANALKAALTGADVLVNTYWVRFNHRDFTFAQAIENSLRLFDAAQAAGVRRIVHISITNPSEDSPFEYFRGKARLERALGELGLSHAILRPAVLFGGEDILINNIAWMLRHLPVFGVFGDGRYKLQPIHVEDLAALVAQHARGMDNVVVDAIGPETFVYRDLVETIAKAIGVHKRIMSIAPWQGLAASGALARITGDVLITRDEIGGLMAGLLATDSAPAGTTRLSDWARTNAATLGRHYHSELARRGDRRHARKED